MIESVRYGILRKRMAFLPIPSFLLCRTERNREGTKCERKVNALSTWSEWGPWNEHNLLTKRHANAKRTWVVDRKDAVWPWEERGWVWKSHLFSEVRMLMVKNLLCGTRQNLVNYLFCKQCILRDEIKGDYSVIWFSLPQSCSHGRRKDNWWLHFPFRPKTCICGLAFKKIVIWNPDKICLRPSNRKSDFVVSTPSASFLSGVHDPI